MNGENSVTEVDCRVDGRSILVSHGIYSTISIFFCFRQLSSFLRNSSVPGHQISFRGTINMAAAKIGKILFPSPGFLTSAIKRMRNTGIHNLQKQLCVRVLLFWLFKAEGFVFLFMSI